MHDLVTLNTFLTALPVLVRMTALVLTLPVLSSRLVPIRFRIALGIVLTLALMPALMPVGNETPLADLQVVPFALSLINEALIGATMGLAVQVVLYGARLAGNVIENMSGLSFGAVAGIEFSGESGHQVLERLFWWTTLAVFVAAGGFTEVIGGIIHSFSLWPAGQVEFHSGILDLLTAALSNGFEFGLRAALPGILALLVASAVLGMTQRNCPQLGGLQIGLGLKSVTGLVVTSLLLLSTPWIINSGVDWTWQQVHQLLTEPSLANRP